MSASVIEHRAQSPQSVRCVVVTVSDTRTAANDSGGQAVVDHLLAAGHVVLTREIVPDDPDRLRPLLIACRDRDDCEAILVTGGTGISCRDLTFETVSELLTKPLPGYGELFRMLSYEQVGPAAMLSRAVAGLMKRTVILTMPGSPAAVRLAMEKLVVPELAHLVREAQR